MTVQAKALRLVLVAAVMAVATVWWSMRAPAVSAHGEHEVGDHVIVFGWQVEPAYAGVYNGPELTITEHDSKKPLEGAEETLKLKVVFGNQSKDLKLRAAWGEPGRYVAQLTPTRPGDYKFVLTGTLDGEPVNLTFDSADGQFSSVEPASDVQFPDSKLDLVNLQSQIDALKKEIATLKAAKK